MTTDGFIGSLVERILEWIDEYYPILLLGEVKLGIAQKSLKDGYMDVCHPVTTKKKYAMNKVIKT